MQYVSSSLEVLSATLEAELLKVGLLCQKNVEATVKLKMEALP